MFEGTDGICLWDYENPTDTTQTSIFAFVTVLCVLAGLSLLLSDQLLTRSKVSDRDWILDWDLDQNRDWNCEWNLDWDPDVILQGIVIGIDLG